MPRIKSPLAADPSLYGLRLGVFADWAPPSREHIETAASLGFKDMVFGVVSTSGTRFEPSKRWSVEKAQEVAEQCQAWGILPHVMFWAARHPQFLDGALDWCVKLMLDKPYFGSVLLDCEGSWHRTKARGFTPELAAEQVSKALLGLNWGVTGLPALHKTVRPLAREAHYVVPQCYSFWKPTTKKHWSHTHRTYPQFMQREGEASWSVLCKEQPGPEMVMGLACYWARRPAYVPLQPALTAAQTMRACAVESHALHVRTAWYWSLKWIVAPGGNAVEVRRFFGSDE